MTDGFLFQPGEPLFEGGFLLAKDVKPPPNGCTNFLDKLRDHGMLIPLPFISIDLVGLRGAERVPADDLKEPDGSP